MFKLRLDSNFFLFFREKIIFLAVLTAVIGTIIGILLSNYLNSKKEYTDISIPWCSVVDGNITRIPIEETRLGINMTTYVENKWMQRCCAMQASENSTDIVLLECEMGTPCYRKVCRVVLEEQ